MICLLGSWVTNVAWLGSVGSITSLGGDLIVGFVFLYLRVEWFFFSGFLFFDIVFCFS